MEQILIDDFIYVESPKRLICCSLTPNFHWIRITRGNTPEPFKSSIDFCLGIYDYLYIRTEDKEALLKAFEGNVKHIPFDFAKGGKL